MTGASLCKLINELTGSKEVQIECEADISCYGVPFKYNTITNIICIANDDARVDFEIAYNTDYRLLQEYRISTRFTYDGA